MKTAALAAFALALPLTALADDFFTLHKIEYLDAPPKDRQARAVYGYRPKPEGRGHLATFKPCLRVTVSAGVSIRSNLLFARAYFYGPDYRLIHTQDAPSPVRRNSSRHTYAWPMVVGKERREIFFEVPPEVRATPGWEALVVWGDRDGATAGQHPGKLMRSRLAFAEKDLAGHAGGSERVSFEESVIEHVVETGIPGHNRLTFLARPPSGQRDFRQAWGALALCVPAHNVAHLKRLLTVPDDAPWAVQRAIDFADRHGLALVTWGTQGLWDSRKNWDEQTERELAIQDRRLDAMMAAWSRGIGELHQRHGLPDKHYLLRGFSGSANFACRLALRQPQHFLAVHVHVSGSYDEPTPEARDVLWCVTSGELDGGYARSLKFAQRCRELGYPIIFKAGTGLGHTYNAQTHRLGRAFFRHALALREAKQARLAPRSPLAEPRPTPDGNALPWPREFREPAFIGDIINQETHPPEDTGLVPEPFRIALPTREIADAWREP